MIWKEISFAVIDITNILFVYKSIVVRLCSNEVKTMGIESRKLLSNSLHPPSKKAVSSDNPFFTWKMFVSVHKDPQDIKNQKIVLKDFLAFQKNENGSQSSQPMLKDSPLKSLPLTASNIVHNNSCYQRE